MNFLILNSYDDVYKKILEEGVRFRAKANGYGLGSGIPFLISEKWQVAQQKKLLYDSFKT